MPLTRLAITHVRNIVQETLALGEKVNVFYGENGSGKTSILEAVHILGLGRSFRHHQLETVICHQSDNLMVVGWITDDESQNHILGIERSRGGKTLIRKDSKDATSIAALAEILPLQLIHPASDELIQGSPKLRRQFMDWGMFHVEHDFLPCWQRLQRVLKQRNAALKLHQPPSAITCWDEEFCLVAEQISQFRRQSIEWLAEYFYPILQTLWPNAAITLQYRRGWSEEKTLSAILQRQLSRDLHTGYTAYGPHRDELLVLCNEQPAAQILSRGEQKLVVIALRLAQGQLLKALAGKTCVFLLDDIGAELDKEHRRAVGDILANLESQVLLTTINLEDIDQAIDIHAANVFHVEHGCVRSI